MRIAARGLENGMDHKIKGDVGDAGGGAEGSGVAVAGHTHARAGVHARRNAHVERLGALDAPLTAARAARGPQAAGSPAARAGNIEAHAPTGLVHGAFAAARGADLRAAGRTGALAARAGIEARDGDLFYRAAHRFPEADVNLVFEVIACFALRAFRVAAAEKLAEKDAKARAARASKIKAVEIEMRPLRAGFLARSGPALIILGIKPELVVHLAFL